VTHTIPVVKSPAEDRALGPGGPAARL